MKRRHCVWLTRAQICILLEALEEAPASGKGSAKKLAARASIEAALRRGTAVTAKQVEDLSLAAKGSLDDPDWHPWFQGGSKAATAARDAMDRIAGGFDES